MQRRNTLANGRVNLGKAPINQFISTERKQAVIICEPIDLFNKKFFLFAVGMRSIFFLLIVFDTGNFLKSALIGYGISGMMVLISALPKKSNRSNNRRLALVMTKIEIGTGGLFRTYTIKWSEIEKIYCNGIYVIGFYQMPSCRLRFHLKDGRRHSSSIPKLGRNDYHNTIDILKWHTTKNNIELIIR